MKLPNFTVAGFAKCGTTSLYHYLKEHPEIFLPSRKELHYFSYETYLKKNSNGPKDKEMHRFHTRTLDEYKAQFKEAGKEFAVGDVSPTYASYEEAQEYLKEILGDDIKVILIVRDPIKRAHSNYLHLVRENRETLSFYEALQQEDKRKEMGYSNFWYYKFNSAYYEKIKKVKEKFDETLVVTFESFIENPEEGIKKIYHFLEVDDTFVPQNLGVQFNPGGVYKENMLTNFIFGRSKLNSWIKEMIPITSGIRKIVHKLTERFKVPKEPIDPQTESYLVEYFEDDVKKLEKEYKVKVEYWNDAFQQ